MTHELGLFSAGDSLGFLGPQETYNYLASIGDIPGAQPFSQGNVAPQGMFGRKTPWRHTGCILGYLPPLSGGGARNSAVSGVSEVAADPALIGKRIKISLDKFYVHDYPGLGEHQILCEFAGKNQVAGETEELRFALQFNVANGGSASISGAPIFMGVTVGSDGISFETRSINVGSSTDETILAVLEDQAFKNGLSLLSTAQPALKPLSALAAGAVKSIVSRSKNHQVHHCRLGLDFSAGSSSARLRHGSYVVVQSDDASTWNWKDYIWNCDSMTLQRIAPFHAEVDFNYMVFGVAPSAETK